MPDDKQSTTSGHAPLHLASQETEEKFKEKMDEIKLREKERATQNQAFETGLGYINLAGFPIGPETISVLTKEQARKNRAICFLKTNIELRLGVVDPLDPALPELIEELKQKNKLNIILNVISEHSFVKALKLYDQLPKLKHEVKGVEISEEDILKFRAEFVSLKDLSSKITQIPLTQIFTMILAAAIEGRASDIHIEAGEDKVKIRFRIDGLLHDVAEIPRDYWPRIISRIKLLAGLKINIDNVPQDGRITIILKNEKIDLRVSTLPTEIGESVVMRVLLSSAAGFPLEELGIRGEPYNLILEEIKRPNGMIINSGPTGSGKTTSLYSFLNKLNTPENKIITIEDPIEYRLEGITQSQVDWEKNYTFAKGLKSIVRQDPDIIMVGEIRDLDTLEIAIQAALTGHLVFSTIHANDAASTLPRFISMGAKPFLLAPALNVVMAQRLVRKICPHCKVEDNLDEKTLTRVKAILSDLPEKAKKQIDINTPKFYKGRGCEKCYGIGYLGRIGIFEVFRMNTEIEKAILNKEATQYKIQEIAVKNGMITMVQDGLLKALDGITSVDEVFRVAQESRA